MSLFHQCHMPDVFAREAGEISICDLVYIYILLYHLANVSFGAIPALFDITCTEHALAPAVEDGHFKGAFINSVAVDLKHIVVAVTVRRKGVGCVEQGYILDDHL